MTATARLAYLGTSEFAATVLRRLAASSHRPGLVVTPPDRARGRGRRVSPPPAATAARELGIEVHQTESVNAEASAALLREAADLGIVCAFGQLIREPLLSDLELLNVHPSLLPRWRGAAPIERAIMAGDRETGVTIMRVDTGLDSGPIAFQEAVRLDADATFEALADRLAALGADLAARAIDGRERGSLDWRDQDEAGATYAEKIAASDRRLDPTMSASELERRVRALASHVGVYVELAGGERLGVRRAQAVGKRIPEGEVAADGEALLLGCADGALRLDVVQPPGGRPMAVEAYLRGHRLPGRAGR